MDRRQRDSVIVNVSNIPESNLTQPPSAWRAWLVLIRVSIRRQARMRQMVWIAVGLLALAVLFVAVNTWMGRWTLTDRRARPTPYSYRNYLVQAQRPQAMMNRAEPAGAIYGAILASVRAALDHSGFLFFSRWMVFAVFQSFLLPLWTLAFATDALGNERENRTLIWLFTRPLPRSSIYLAKWISSLPWCLGFNLFGFGAICIAAGEPGSLAFRLYWPAIIWGTLAYSALFHLIAALFRRPAIIGLLYAFFFEALVGDLPGDLKRMSLSFYIRSLMFDATKAMDLSPDSLTVYAPVSGWTALGVLTGLTIMLNLFGMWRFSRQEYPEDV